MGKSASGISEEGAWRQSYGYGTGVFVVVHVTDFEQALRNTAIAIGSSADGVFLINHSIGHRELLRICSEVQARIPCWMGVNCLDLEPQECFPLLSPRIRALWVDNAQIDERESEQPEAAAILAAQKASGWDGFYFGGVAFKYQREVEDLETACRIAPGYMDVVTTSGPGTGRAADVEKLKTMKKALGRFPLAVASGVTPDNVFDFIGIADVFLVATGISRTFEELDPILTARLVGAVRAARRRSRCLGGRQASAAYFRSLGKKPESDLLPDYQTVRLVSIVNGALFEIDLAAFPEEAPRFIYTDDVEGRARPILGLLDEGPADPLPGPLKEEGNEVHSRVFQARRDEAHDGKVRLLSLGYGEFSLAISHLHPDGTVRALWCDSFVFK